MEDLKLVFGNSVACKIMKAAFLLKKEAVVGECNCGQKYFTLFRLTAKEPVAVSHQANV